MPSYIVTKKKWNDMPDVIYLTDCEDRGEWIWCADQVASDDTQYLRAAKVNAVLDKCIAEFEHQMHPTQDEPIDHSDLLGELKALRGEG